MQKIKFAIVGCGHIGKRHAEMVQRNQFCELVALVDIKNELHASLLQLFKVDVFSSLDQYLSQEKLADIIVVATPNGTHATLAIEALAAGCHVVIEKPMALYSSDCKKIIDIALLHNKHIFCVMQNRYSPPSVWLKSIINANILGDIYLVQINCFWNRDERYYKPDGWKGDKTLDGGTLYTQFSHFIDMMYWLFGDIKDIKSFFKDINHQKLTDFEDTGLVNFSFVNGGIGTLNYTTSVYNKNLESSMTIIAEHGTIKVGGQYMEEVIYCDIKNYQMPELLPTNPANDYGHYKGSASNHHYIIENIVDVIKGTDTIHTPAVEGMKVVEIIEKIYVSC